VLNVAADMLFLVSINYAVIAAHELAHAAAGKALGVRVFRVIVGRGRICLSRRLFGMDWELHVWPFGGGTVMASPPQPGGRARFFGAVLAGPVMHVVLIAAAIVLQVILLVLQGWFGLHAVDLLHWTNVFLFFNLVLLVQNLLPTKSGAGFGQLGTDGFQLLHLLLQQPAEEIHRSLAYYVLEEREIYSSNRNGLQRRARFIRRCFPPKRSRNRTLNICSTTISPIPTFCSGVRIC
jgi:hypothetical protein